MSERPVIAEGPCPGLLGDVAAMHGRYYAAHWNFPVYFEAKVARDMGDFLVRFDPERDAVFHIEVDGRVRASITVDGSDPELPPGQMHLRWFIADESLAGRGLGRQMLMRALDAAKERGARSIYLTTFDGLGPAMALYMGAGFKIVDEQAGATWGTTVLEQRMELTF